MLRRYRQGVNSVFNTTWHDTKWQDTTWHDTTQQDTILQTVYTLTQLGSVSWLHILSTISITPPFFILHILGSGCWYIIESLFCIFLMMTNEVEDLFIGLTIGYPRLWCIIKPFICSFFYELFWFVWKNCIFWMRFFFSDIFTANIFTCFVTSFTLFMVAFDELEFLILIYWHYSIVSFIIGTFLSCFTNICLLKCRENIFLSHLTLSSTWKWFLYMIGGRGQTLTSFRVI